MIYFVHLFTHPLRCTINVFPQLHFKHGKQELTNNDHQLSVDCLFMWIELCKIKHSYIWSKWNVQCHSLTFSNILFLFGSVPETKMRSHACTLAAVAHMVIKPTIFFIPVELAVILKYQFPRTTFVQILIQHFAKHLELYIQHKSGIVIVKVGYGNNHLLRV